MRRTGSHNAKKLNNAPVDIIKARPRRACAAVVPSEHLKAEGNMLLRGLQHAAVLMSIFHGLPAGRHSLTVSKLASARLGHPCLAPGCSACSPSPGAAGSNAYSAATEGQDGEQVA